MFMYVLKYIRIKASAVHAIFIKLVRKSSANHTILQLFSLASLRPPFSGGHKSPISADDTAKQAISPSWTK